MPVINKKIEASHAVQKLTIVHVGIFLRISVYILTVDKLSFKITPSSIRQESEALSLLPLRCLSVRSSHPASKVVFC